MSDDEGARSRPATISGNDIALLFLMSFMCQAISYNLLDGIGLFRWFYGGDGLREALHATGPEALVSRYRIGLWTGVLSGILQLVVTLGWTHWWLGVPLESLGLTRKFFLANVGAGMLLAVLFAPGAYVIQALTLPAMRWLGQEEQPHPFTLLGQESLYPVEWVWMFLSAVCLAPLWEELFYRGIIQPCVMANQPKGGWVALAGALGILLVARSDYIQQATAQGGRPLLLEAIPIGCLALLALLYLFWSRRTSAQSSALLASAILFGFLHSRVWPTPLPLVWLALGLGWLRWRSGSLVGPIALHAAFNGIAWMLLLNSR